MLIRALALGALFALWVNPAQATLFLVTSPMDETTPGNGCSIREAVENTDNAFLSTNTPHPDCPVGSAPDLIQFDESIDTILLNAPLQLTGSVTVSGGGRVVLDGQNASQLIVSTPAFGNSNVLERITLRNGTSTGNGGCIVNSAVLFVTEVRVHGCYAALNGGGIATTNSVIATRSTVEDNEANPAAPTAGAGGGIFGNSGQVRLIDSTINGNRARVGGGVFTNVPAHFFNATLAHNQASQTGGGVLYSNANPANRSHLRFSTFVANSAPSGGSGIHAAGAINLYQSLVAGNTGSTNCLINGPGGLISDGNYNLDDGSSCGFGAGGSLNNADMSGLGALRDNGGPTFTIASDLTPATDAAACDLINVPRDQRGATRPFGGLCDIGAYEYAKYTLTYTVAGAASLRVGGQLLGLWSEVLDFDQDGSSVEVVPQPGYRFVQWSDGSTANPRVDAAVRADLSVVAEIQPWEVLPAGPLPGGTYDAPYAPVQFSTVGGTEPHSYSIASGSLPPGLALSSAGALAGTPTLPGTFSFTLRVTDAVGSQVNEDYDIVVSRAVQEIDLALPAYVFARDVGEILALAPYVSVSSGLSVTVTVDNPEDEVCLVEGTDLLVLAEGWCDFTIDQTGNAFYLPAAEWNDSVEFMQRTLMRDSFESHP